MFVMGSLQQGYASVIRRKSMARRTNLSFFAMFGKCFGSVEVCKQEQIKAAEKPRKGESQV